ncbi:hypothetical protein D3C73_1044630 [compost metagenome]
MDPAAVTLGQATQHAGNHFFINVDNHDGGRGILEAVQRQRLHIRNDRGLDIPLHKRAQRANFTAVGFFEKFLAPLFQGQVVIVKHLIKMLRTISRPRCQDQIVIGQIDIIVLQKIIRLPGGQHILHRIPDSVDIRTVIPFVHQHTELLIDRKLPCKAFNLGHAALQNVLALLQLRHAVLDGQRLRDRNGRAVGHIPADARNDQNDDIGD